MLKNIIDSLIKDLPSYVNRCNSVIAGGAICNLLYNQKHNENAPVNDIDIFTFIQRATEDISLNQDGAMLDYVGDIQDSINNLKILDTKRDGIFNIINVEVDYIFNLSELGRQLVNNFDINATQAFITLDDLNIMTLKSFDEFLETKQLKITSTNTPIKTMLRILKKHKEFNCFFDSNQIKILFQFARFKTQNLTEESVSKFSEQIIALKDYFRVFKMADKKYKVFLNRDTHNIKLHRTEKTIIKGKNNKILIPILEEYYKESKLYKKYLKIRPYRKTTKIILENKVSLKEYLKDDFNPKEIVNIEKVIKNVEVIKDFLMTLKLNEAIQFCQKLSRIEDKNLFMYTCGKLSTYAFFELYNIDNFIKKTKNEYSDAQTPLIEALPVKIHGIQELISKFSLNEEGRLMGHCVGGYSHKIQSGLCRIFSIKTNEGNSTIEIHQIDLKSSKVWVGIQHRSKFNKMPHKENRILALNLLNMLNGFCQKSEPEQIASADFF